MERQNFRAHLAALVGVVLATACSVGPDGSYSDLQPLVFPSEGRLGTGGLGSTAAILLDSNYIEGFDIAEMYDLHRSRVTVTVVDPLGVFPSVPANVRSVFGLQATSISLLHASKPGAWVTAVLVDLPAASALGGPLTYPFTAELQVSIDSTLDFAPRFIVVGEGGSPNDLLDAAFASPAEVNSTLEPRPALRLRPKRGAGGFQEGEPPVGGIQFDVSYMHACISNVFAFPGSEAADAGCHVGPVLDTVGDYKRRRVLLADASGFNLAFLADEPGFDTTDETLAGDGPLVDLAINWKATNNSACNLLNPDLIHLSDLHVTDRDGNPLFAVAGPVEVDTVDLPSTTAYFRSYAIDLPPPAPSGGGGCGIGFELVPVLITLIVARRKRSRRF